MSQACIHPASPPPGAAVRRASLGSLASHRTVLLLQGPNGPFFARLARWLRQHGCRVFKVNFNAGDACFYRGGGVTAFREHPDRWPQFLRALAEANAVEAIAMFGQWRPHHRSAIELAESLDLPFYVFEEGYVRPWWITFERGEVNAGSSLRNVDPASLPDEAPPTRPATIRFGFLCMAWWSAIYFACGLVFARRYPHYRHHKPFRWAEALFWSRALVRKIRYVFSERRLRARLLDPYGPDFFLVPLQLSGDSQLVFSSPWQGNKDFLAAVILSFARHAPSSDHLVVKHHPMERGHTDYQQEIARLAEAEGVASRVHYLHDGHVPSLLKRSKGAVLVNSTVGIQALYHNVPVFVCGDAFYARRGLVASGTLDAFWSEPQMPARRAFVNYYRYILRTTQINQSFYAGGGFPATESTAARAAAHSAASVRQAGADDPAGRSRGDPASAIIAKRRPWP
ncbi:MAG: capsule biosynthesis protein [Cupriavidus necator]